MSGFGGQKGGFDGFQLAHLAHQNHVRVLPQDGAEAVGEGAGILTHLPLVDGAFVALIDVFDGVFQRNDMLGVPVVDDIQQAGQGGALTGAGFAGDQDDALVEAGEALTLLGKPDFGYGGDMIVEDSDGRGDTALLAEQIHAAAHPVSQAEGQILLANLGDFLVVGADGPGVILAVLGGQPVVVHVHQPAVDTQPDRNAPDNVDVTGPAVQSRENDGGKGNEGIHGGYRPYVSGLIRPCC